ncbi:hypothetical protein PT974_05540 [Cladobotryum mycophilum]|uniref:MACPF domain-containing protein n=1 Tax=Cladobotryum mycophilum TaxID=491253 RepID=A0ABR0SJ22_9HYPO
MSANPSPKADLPSTVTVADERESENKSKDDVKDEKDDKESVPGDNKTEKPKLIHAPPVPKVEPPKYPSIIDDPKLTLPDESTRLTAPEWADIIRSNSLCYGLNITHKLVNNVLVPSGFTRAKFPAFQVASLAKNPPEIPDVQNEDEASISIFETKDDMQHSLAISSFSQTNVGASATALIEGLQIGGSLGYANQNDNGSVQNDSTKDCLVHISYNLPRVQMFLNSYTLQLTPECKKDLDAITNEAMMSKFLSLYGEIFTTQVVLGGRLYAVKAYSARADGDIEVFKKGMAFNASRDFATPVGGANLGGGHGSSSAKQDKMTIAGMTNELQWQAIGGDALLANNPPAWCPTVALSKNWMVIERPENFHMIDLLVSYAGYEGLKKFVQPEKPILPMQTVTLPLFYLRLLNSKALWDFAYLRLDFTILGIYEPFPSVSPWVRKSGGSGDYLLLTDMRGNTVYEPQYGVPYRIQSHSTSLFLDYGSGMLYSSSIPPGPTCGWEFWGKHGTESGPIKQESEVRLRRVNCETSVPVWNGSFLAYQTLALDVVRVVEALNKDAEISFSFLWKSKWDGTS